MRNADKIASLMQDLLEELGEDPIRDGLKETPHRAARAWLEWTRGYEEDPAELFKTFDLGHGIDEMVMVSNIPVLSRCEHHLADIVGIAHVAYIPAEGRIVGISKLARLVDLYARRLQVQERLTNQIVDAVAKYLAPVGAACLIRARHHCMETRGVRMPRVVTTTSALRGAIFEKPPAREEFLALCRDAERGL